MTAHTAELRATLHRRGTRFMTVYVLVALALLFATRQSDVLSCQRQQHPRLVLHAFIQSNAQFQRALGAFDAAADRRKRRVTLGGRVLLLSRAGLRDWIARQWEREGLRVKPPDCGGIFPTGT